MSAEKEIYEFSDFRLDGGQRLLFRRGEVVALPPKAVELLLALLEEPGRLCTKDDLLRRVWPDVVVDESNLSQNIFLLRKALGDDGNRWIVTVPRRGYRFAGELSDGLEMRQTAPPSGPLEPPPGPSETKRSSPRFMLAAGAVVVVGLLVGGWIVRRAFHEPKPEATAIHSIAVLPFRSIDAQHRDVALEVGVADTLINRLSLLPDTTVVPTRAISHYASGEVDPLTAGRELKVDAVIDGNLQTDGGRIRSTVRLLRVADGRAIWADRYDDSHGSVFDLEDHLAEHVVDALHIRLDPQSRSDLVKRYTENQEAYRLYAEGHFAWSSFTPDGLMRSLRCYEAALKKDPHYALAYVGLANAYNVIGIYGPLQRDDAFNKARQAAERAVALDPNLADAHTALAGVKIFHDWNWQGAESDLRRAIAIGPNQINGHALLGYVLQALGRTGEALSEELRARDLDPSWFVPRDDVINSLLLDRRYDEVLRRGEENLALDASDGTMHYYVARARLMKGDLSGGEREARAALGVTGGLNPLWVIGQIDAMRGDQKGYAEVEQRLRASAKTDFGADYSRAMLCATTGHLDEAFEALDNACASRYPFLYEARTDPAFDSLRHDPRYQLLLTKLHLGGT
ncbi:MAG TPA: winged helix-turn-helix domain-containing protein [Vicinamibacterales bacterium]